MAAMTPTGALRVAVSLTGGSVCLFVWGVTWDEYQLRMHQIRQDVMLLACMSFFWAVLYYFSATWRPMSTLDPYSPSSLPWLIPVPSPAHREVSGVQINSARPLQGQTVQLEKLTKGQIVKGQKPPQHHIASAERIPQSHVVNIVKLPPHQSAFAEQRVPTTEKYQDIRSTHINNPNWPIQEHDDSTLVYPDESALFDHDESALFGHDESALLLSGAKEGVYLCCSFLCHLLLILLNILHMESLLRYLYFSYRQEEGVVSTQPTLSQSFVLTSPLFVIFVNVSMSVVFLLRLLLTGAFRSHPRMM